MRTTAPPISATVQHARSGFNWVKSEQSPAWEIAQVATLTTVLANAVLLFGTTEPWSGFVLQVGAVILFLVWAGGQMAEGTVHLRPSPLYLSAVAFAALIIFQLLSGISAYRYATMQEAQHYCAYGMILFVAIQTFHRRENIQRFVTGMSIFGFVLAAFAIIQGLTWNGKLYWFRQPRFTAWYYGPFVNHSHWAGMMELLTPLPLALMMSKRTTLPKKLLLGFAVLIMGSTIFLSGSRGGMAAFAVKVTFGTVVLLLRGRSSERIRDLAILFVFAIVFLAWVGGSRVTDRIESAYSADGTTMGNTLDARFRLAMYKDTFAMAKARPLTGWGLDCFSHVFPAFQSFYTDRFVNAAHNDYLQLLAETGLVGFAIMLWFIFAVYRSALRPRVPGFVASAKLAAAVGCLGILVHSLVDFNMHVPANAAMFYVLAALAAAEGVEGSSPVIVSTNGPILVHDITLN